MNKIFKYMFNKKSLYFWYPFIGILFMIGSTKFLYINDNIFDMFFEYAALRTVWLVVGVLCIIIGTLAASDKNSTY